MYRLVKSRQFLINYILSLNPPINAHHPQIPLKPGIFKHSWPRSWPWIITNSAFSRWYLLLSLSWFCNIMLENKWCQINIQQYQNDIVTFKMCDNAQILLVYPVYLPPGKKTTEVFILNPHKLSQMGMSGFCRHLCKRKMNELPIWRDYMIVHASEEDLLSKIEHFLYYNINFVHDMFVWNP